MKKLLLFTIFAFSSLFAFSQTVYNDCASIPGPDNILVGDLPYSFTVDLTTANGYTGVEPYATSLVGGQVNGFYQFTIPSDGNYDIVFIASGGASAASGDLSVGLSDGGCPSAETDFQDISTGFQISCEPMLAASTYDLSLALLAANEGEFTITIQESNDVCSISADEVFLGDNIVDNNCGSSGLVWFQYTVIAEDNVDITITGDGTPANPAVEQIWLNGCPSTGTDMTGMDLNCLTPGDVLYIQAGDDSPDFGDWTLTIDESSVDNDECVDSDDLGQLTCSNSFSEIGDTDACSDAEAVCVADPMGIWYTFTVNPLVHTFSFSGTDFEVFTGTDCASLAPFGCAGDGALTNATDAGETYWVLVYDSGDFTVQSDNNVPLNDDCTDAIELFDGTPELSSTACADVEITTNFCAQDANSHQVFFEYNNLNATPVDLDVNISASGVNGITEADVLVLTDCGGTLFNGVNEFCGVVDNQFTIECIEPGETLFLVVGSEDTDEGDFNITITENVSPVGNDECLTPLDYGTLGSCEWTQFDSDNSDACPEDFGVAGCDFDTEPVVWFEFTTPADAVAVEFQNLNAAGAPFLGLFEDDGDCDNMTAVDAGSACITGDDGPFAVSGNTTYVIAMGSTGGEGALSFEIKAITPPDNDDCTTPDDLVDGAEGTTACATEWVGWTYCSIDATSHVVYYTYENTFGSNVDLELTINGSTATTGTEAIDVEVAVIEDDCTTPTFYQNQVEECNAKDNLINIDCIEVGETIIVAIASLDGEEGDFSISLTETPNGVLNDECTDAEVIAITTPCEWETYNGDNTDACFEDFSFGGCDFNLDPVVWFRFTATADATSVEFDNIIGAGTPYLAIFEDGADCDNPTAVAGSGCVTGTDGPFDIVGGNDYLIAFGSSAGEGAFSFDMKINETPTNDDPCDGSFAPEVLSAGTFTDNNTCAGPDFTFCSVDNTTGKTLFYEYTMTQDADLEVTVAGVSAGGPLYIAAYESVACMDESTFITENCADQQLILPCLEAGETIIIAVATGDAPGEYGEYDITITELTPVRPDNDECVDAEVIDYTDADLCTWVDAENNESNINACSEDNDFGTGCDYDTEEVVWYTFTAPNATSTAPASTLNIQFLNYDGTGDLFTTVFEDGADCANLTPISPCVTGLGPHGNLVTVQPNTTYLIGVGSTGDTGGNFELQINITSGPPNDDPCADLSAYDLNGGGLSDQTNLCAGPDGNFPDCTGEDQENAVIYTFEIVDPNYGIEITVTENNSNGTPIMGTIVAGVSSANDDFCTGTTYTPPAYCEDISNATFVFDCLEEGTYQLKISSSEMNSGDFDISSTLITKNTGCAESDNADYCSEADANAISNLEECMPTTISGCNKEACEESFDWQACDFSNKPTVWYSFTALAGAVSADITNFSTDIGGGILTILEADCDNLMAVSDCIQEGNDELNIAVMENTTYYIAVGQDPNGASFEFDITLNVPPENDDPCPTFANPPYDLTGGGSHNGTTCCAIGFNDDPGADYQNLDCPDASTDDNAVWYIFTPDPSSADGFEIEVDGSISGFTTVEVYHGPADGGCTGNLTLLASACTTLPIDPIRKGYCFPEGESVYIKVGSSDDDCGDFTIAVNEVEDCKVADECADITGEQTLMPVTDPNFEDIEYVCLPGCLDLACPEDPLPAGGNGCDFTQLPTVWYAVTVDDIAAQLFTTVTTNGSWTPIWSVYYGDDCDNLTNAASGSTPPCSLDDDSPDLHQTGVEDLYDTYYVAVTADPNGEPIDDPNFEICGATIINVLVCLGDIDDNCEPDPSTEIMITDRENADLEPDVDPEVGYMGPFCPGEEVEVHIEFFYDATESGADWMIGFVPDFGPGWDMEDYDFDGNAPGGSGGTGEWHEAFSDCEATMEEPVPHLCTYTDDQGVLRLCNSLCEACPDCDELGMAAGDVLPSGYFWISDGSNSGCVNGSCRPGQQWGIGSTTSQINWDFTLTVREFEDEDECLENNELQITFQTFSDGGAGCWEDPVGECLIDRKQLGPNWKVECAQPPNVISSPQPREICTEGIVDINVITDDGSDLDIEVTFDDNPNVDGENTYVFSGGFGTIIDVLTLADGLCNPEEVVYYARAIDPNIKCAGKEDTIYVTVYPNPEIEQDEIPGECYPSLSQFNLEDYLECEGYPGELIWNWQETTTGQSGNNSNIQFNESFDPGLYTYSVTVTDELGCNSVDEVQFEIFPPVHFTLRDTTVCYDDEAFLICPEFDEEGTPDYDYLWTFDCFPSVDYGDCFFIDPIVTSQDCDDETSWDLNLLVTDANNCIFDTTITITINPSPEFDITPNNPSFCAGQSSVEVCLENIFADVDYVAWEQPNGDIIESYVPFYCAELTQLGDHTVYLYDLTGCVSEYTFFVGENTIPEPTFEGDTIICLGETTTLTVVGDYETYLWRHNGATSVSVDVSPTVTTTYTVDVTDENLCYATGEVTVHVLSTELPALPDTASFCAGFSTQINAGAGFDEYHWYQGSTTGTEVGTSDTLVVTEEDWYYIEVFLEGCPALDSIFVQSDDELSPSVFGDFLLCFEEDSTLVIATGGAFIDYIWTDTETNTVVGQGNSLDSIYLPEGSYELWVSDGSCAGTETFTIDKKAPVVVDIFPAVDTVDICFNTDTMLYATPGFITYEWVKNGNTISVNDTLFDVTKGSYKVMVTDEDGCIGVDSIYVREFPPVLPNLGPDQDICATDIATLTPGTGFTTYTWWYDGVENPTWANEDSLFVNDGGEYVVEVTNAIGCSERDTVIVNKTDELMPVIIGNAEICEGDVLTLSVQQVYDNYEWTNQAGTVLSTGDTLNVTLAGTYYLMVTSNTGCTGTDEAVVVVNIPPNAIVNNGPFTVCGQGSTNPGFLNFASYVNAGSDPGDWTDTDGAGVVANADWSNVDFSNVPAGTYTFTFTTNIAVPPCVDDVETITVVVETCLCDQFTIDPIDPVCNDRTDDINLSTYLYQADGLAVIGTWSIVSGPGGNPLNGNLFDISEALEGTYTLQYTLTNQGNFCWDSQTVDIFVADAKEADIVDDIIPACGFDSSNGSSVLDFTMYINSSDQGTWDDTNGAGVIANGDWSSVDFSNVLPGTYVFTFTTTGAVAPCANVSDALVVEVTECDCDILIINPIDPVCNEGSGIIDLSAYLDSNPTGLTFDGTWSITDGPGDNPLNGSNFDPSLSIEGGTYTLTFTHNTQGNWCEASQSVVLTIERAPVIGVVADAPETCFGTAWSGLQLESLIEGEDLGGTWTETSTTPSIGGAFDPVAGTFNTIDQVAGTYTFEYSLAGGTYCGPKSIEVQVTINPLPIADAGEPKFGCFGDVVLVGGSSSNGAEYAYEWKNQDGQVVSTDRTFEISQSGTYTVVVTNTLTGCIDQDVTEVEIFPNYSGTITGKDLLIDGETEILRLNLTDLDPSQVGSYQWYRNGDLIAGANADTLFIEEDGLYCVDIIPAGNDESACIVQVCKSVNTVLTKEVYIPNIFSPNTDGDNDIFTVEGGKNVQRINNVSIYDRWGELVFQSGNFTLDKKYEFGWDGRFKGQAAMQGVYVYVVEVLYNDDTRETVSGDVTLIR
jgi:gliding motility-associated-like protein